MCQNKLSQIFLGVQHMLSVVQHMLLVVQHMLLVVQHMLLVVQHMLLVVQHMYVTVRIKLTQSSWAENGTELGKNIDSSSIKGQTFPGIGSAL
jgi:hypothetical protein